MIKSRYGVKKKFRCVSDLYVIYIYKTAKISENEQKFSDKHNLAV
jgi:hypothetical protein